MQLYYAKMQSPVGPLHLLAGENDLQYLVFDDYWPTLQERFKDHLQLTANPVIDLAIRELQEYFNGQREQFTVPVQLHGTEFQRQTWETLRTIPFGKILTYGEQAQLMKNPKAVRAIGQTNGKNPIAIIVPCHRVIGKSGHLTGYAGGIQIKEKLLRLEGVLL